MAVATKTSAGVVLTDVQPMGSLGPPNLALTDTSQLLDKAQTEVLDPCQRMGIVGVQSLGFHPLFDHIRLVEAKGSDWLIFPME